MEKPILFSGEMVRAILDGRKTMTRRVVRPQPEEIVLMDGKRCRYIKRGGDYEFSADVMPAGVPTYVDLSSTMIPCPYGRPGDALWVREGFRFGHAPNDEDGQGIALYADNSHRYHPDLDPVRFYWCREYKKRPSIFMPRWASRITLRVTDVRVDRLQGISEEDISAEGIKPDPDIRSRLKFAFLWNKINEARGYGWDSNPYVWVVSFEMPEVTA